MLSNLELADIAFVDESNFNVAESHARGGEQVERVYILLDSPQIFLGREPREPREPD